MGKVIASGAGASRIFRFAEIGRKAPRRKNICTEDHKGHKDRSGVGFPSRSFGSAGAQSWYLFVIFVAFCSKSSLVFRALEEESYSQKIAKNTKTIPSMEKRRRL